eukprot:26276_1
MDITLHLLYVNRGIYDYYDQYKVGKLVKLLALIPSSVDLDELFSDQAELQENALPGLNDMAEDYGGRGPFVSGMGEHEMNKTKQQIFTALVMGYHSKQYFVKAQSLDDYLHKNDKKKK